jgi:hypothetical protein
MVGLIKDSNLTIENFRPGKFSRCKIGQVSYLDFFSFESSYNSNEEERIVTGMK